MRKSIKTIEVELTSFLKSIEKEVLEKVATINNIKTKTLESFHGEIGSKNRKFAKTIEDKFQTPHFFLSAWLSGLKDKMEKDIKKGYNKTSSQKLAQYLKEPVISNYIQIFLERNFYRNYRGRTRNKAPRVMWSISFGDNKNCWILNLAPLIRDQVVTTDRSKMIKADYQYWTIGHLLTTGIIDFENNRIRSFSSIANIKDFYFDVFKKPSKSPYEKNFIEIYFEHIESLPSENQKAIPLLIPEYRYSEDQSSKRIDFVILNSYTMKFTGFELSPQSSHLSVKGIKSKTQKKLNEEIKEAWQKEIDKRNMFLEKQDIRFFTLADDQLKDIKLFFNKHVIPCLISTTTEYQSPESILSEIIKMN